jgi:peptidoglycan/LPS O-acetylase OafA/YrhL
MDSGSARGKRIAVLDGWRGVSILGVVAAHTLNLRFGSFDPVHPGFAAALGPFGVDMFFVVSGYVISLRAIAEKAQRGRFSPGLFYLRRVFRILPAFYLYLAVIAAAGWLGLVQSGSEGVLYAAGFLCNLSVFDCGHLVAHSWTLAFEEQFYLVFPLVFVMLPRVTLRWTAAAVFVLLLFLPGARYALQLEGAWRTLAHMAPPFCFVAAGVCAAVFDDTFIGFAKRPQAAPAAVFAWIVGGTIVATSALLAPTPGTPAAYMQAVIVGLTAPLCFAWLVLTTVRRPGYATRLLSWKPLRALGVVSYGLYLWQQLFTAPPALLGPHSPFVLYPLILVAPLASYYLVERPANRLGHRLSHALAARGRAAQPDSGGKVGAAATSL